MAARIKNLEAGKEGVEFEVRSKAGDFLGDMYVTDKGLIWCQGKTAKANGTEATWAQFIEWMNE